MPPPPRTRARHGLTLIEMVVVLVVLGLLLGFTLPRIVGSDTFARDQKSQTTASGALDSMVQLYLAAGVRDGQNCTQVSSDPTVPRQQMDGTVAADGTIVPYGTTPTSCPVFTNPTDLHDANGDVKFVAGNTASTANSVASVAAVKTSTGWRLAVAVLSPVHATDPGSVSSCWIAWHQFPSATGGVSQERYFTRTNVSTTDATNCTGDVATVYETDSYCDNPSTDGSEPPLGRSWRRPCPDYH